MTTKPEPAPLPEAPATTGAKRFALDPRHNFYSLGCSQTGQMAYFRVCGQRIKEIGAGAQGVACPPECVTAVRRGRCPAVALMREQLATPGLRFYLDRDDRGPGVTTRRELGLEPRGDDEAAYHHALVDGIIARDRKLGLPVPSADIYGGPRPERRPAVTRARGFPKEAEVAPERRGGSGLADLINEELAEKPPSA